MANIKKSLKENAPGNFFVDSTCIDCDACRKIAPNTFDHGSGYSIVTRQPTTDEEVLAAKQALLSCPVGCIGMQEKLELKSAIESFPQHIIDNVYLNGFNHKKSYGADSYFIKSSDGNWLIDSPRFNKSLVNKFKEMGGIKYIYLTHRDDVADADKFAKEFNAKRIIHEDDLDAQKDSEVVLKGQENVNIDNALIIPVPGHTKGHTVLLWDNKFLFTGDHFSWSRTRGDWNAFKDFCWYDWSVQIESMKKLEQFNDVEFVFPGHGTMKAVPKGDFSGIISNVVQWMQESS